MTIASPTPGPPGLSAGEFLYGVTTTEEIAPSLAEPLNANGAGAAPLWSAHRLSRFALSLVGDEIAKLAATYLGHDLGGMVKQGLDKIEELQEAARTTLVNPQPDPMPVKLRDTTVQVTHHRQVDVLLNRKRIYTLRFDLLATFDLDVVTAHVNKGCLVSFDTGDCKVEVTLSLAEDSLHPTIDLVGPLAKEIDPNLLIPLPEPLPLIAEARHQLP